MTHNRENRGGEEEFADRILNWYRRNGRHYLPWRNEDIDPYEILIAEILLQKTTADQVEDVFPSFLDRFPTIPKLAQASKEEILDVIEELGLAYKAERMRKVAKEILSKHNGNVPENFDELIELNGVGKYTANSILCYAFGKDRAVVDTNVGRVLKRVFALDVEGRLRQSNKLWTIAEKLVPKDRAKEYNLAVIDLGALICHKNNPSCEDCPVKDICGYNVKRKADKQ